MNTADVRFTVSEACIIHDVTVNLFYPICSCPCTHVLCSCLASLQNKQYMTIRQRGTGLEYSSLFLWNKKVTVGLHQDSNWVLASHHCAPTSLSQPWAFSSWQAGLLSPLPGRDFLLPRTYALLADREAQERCPLFPQHMSPSGGTTLHHFPGLPEVCTPGGHNGMLCCFLLVPVSRSACSQLPGITSQ